MAFGLILGLAGTALSAGGQLSAAAMQKRAAEQKAENQRVSAAGVLRQAELNSIILRKQGKQAGGQARAISAASGVSVGSGSPLQAMIDTVGAFAEQEYQMREEANRTASLIRMGALETEKAGADAARATRLGAVSSALSGGFSLSQFLDPKKTVVPVASGGMTIEV